MFKLLVILFIINAIPTTNTSILVNKADYVAKIREIQVKIPAHEKYITHGFGKLTSDYFAARLKEADLASKKNIADFVKKTDFDKILKKLIKKLLQIKQNM